MITTIGQKKADNVVVEVAEKAQYCMIKQDDDMLILTPQSIKDLIAKLQIAQAVLAER